MATKNEDLLSAGMEGFAIVEKYMIRKGWPPATKRKTHAPKWHTQHTGCNYQYQPQQNPLYQVKPDPPHEVVKFGDGASFMDYSKRKSSAVSY